MNKVEEIFLQHFPTGIESPKVNEKYLLFMMKSLWNTAIQKAADIADADFNIESTKGEFTFDDLKEGEDYTVYVLKGSILKLLIE